MRGVRFIYIMNPEKENGRRTMRKGPLFSDLHTGRRMSPGPDETPLYFLCRYR